MKREFMSVLPTPWGEFGIYASREGITEIFCSTSREAAQPVPYDLDHAWKAYESGLSDSLHLPLDLTASPQVHMLLLAVRAIPRGECRDLAEVIRDCGLSPEEAQQVLDRCPLPLAIPLHRVRQYQGLPVGMREEICRFEAEHPRLPKPEIPWVQK